MSILPKTDLDDQLQSPPSKTIAKALPVSARVAVGEQTPDPAVKGYQNEKRPMLLDHIPKELLPWPRKQVIAIQKVQRLRAGPSKLTWGSAGSDKASSKGLEQNRVPEVVRSYLLGNHVVPLQCYPGPLILNLDPLARCTQLWNSALRNFTSFVLSSNTSLSQGRVIPSRHVAELQLFAFTKKLLMKKRRSCLFNKVDQQVLLLWTNSGLPWWIISRLSFTYGRVEGDVGAEMLGSRLLQRHGDAKLPYLDLSVLQADHHVKCSHGWDGHQQRGVAIWHFRWVDLSFEAIEVDRDPPNLQPTLAALSIGEMEDLLAWSHGAIDTIWQGLLILLTPPLWVHAGSAGCV